MRKPVKTAEDTDPEHMAVLQVCPTFPLPDSAVNEIQGLPGKTLFSGRGVLFMSRSLWYSQKNGDGSLSPQKNRNRDAVRQLCPCTCICGKK